MPARGERELAVHGPVSATRFTVDIDGRGLAVARVSAPTLAADPATLTRRPAGRAAEDAGWSATPETGSMSFARALDADRTLYAWRRDAIASDPKVRNRATRNVTIRLLNAEATDSVAVFHVTGAWPLRWSGPELDALVGAVAFEELRIVYDDVTMS